jgi:hypothetical protein
MGRRAKSIGALEASIGHAYPKLGCVPTRTVRPLERALLRTSVNHISNHENFSAIAAREHKLNLRASCGKTFLEQSTGGGELRVSPYREQVATRVSEDPECMFKCRIQSATGYASQMKDRVADTARDYPSQMKDRISDTARRFRRRRASPCGGAFGPLKSLTPHLLEEFEFAPRNPLISWKNLISLENLNFLAISPRKAM